MNISKQKPKTDWQDEAGKTMPYSSIKNSEKVYEMELFAVAKKALKVHNELEKLKAFIQASVNKCIDAFHRDYKGKKTEFKGNYTIRNFNDTIKVEVSVSNPISFDDMTIQKARETFKEFLADGVTTKDDTIKQMVLDAFETSRGRLDVDKIMSLKRYSDRIDDPRWKKAMKLIDQAIRRPSTAKYFRVWVKDDAGKYQNITLALANV
jgi:hypothetical protein